MSKKINKIIIFFCLSLLSYTSFGQNNTNSPYSMFGIGDLFSGNYGRSASMGGVGTSLFSINSLNPSNPASYAAIAPSTFIFEVGLAGNWYKVKSSDNSFKKFDGNVRSLAIGFPVAKWWKMGLGINPISSIGYDIEQTYPITDTTSYTTTYKGEGGVNSFYFDNSFQVLKFLSVGAKVSYLFGSLDRTRDEYASNIISNTEYYESNKWIFNSFSYGIGAHFHKQINTNLTLYAGVNYNFNADLPSSYKQFSTLSVTKFLMTKIDTVLNTNNGESKIEIPQNFSIGASALLFQKLELAFDYQKDSWSKTNFNDQNYSDNKRYSFGLEYIPDAGSSVYLKLVRYRAGFNYINSYLMYDNQALRQIGASVGLGLPLRSGAIINLGIIYNHRNVPNRDVLTEDFLQLNLNFTFMANWFVKRHFF
jgi:hypothetical protein